MKKQNLLLLLSASLLLASCQNGENKESVSSSEESSVSSIPVSEESDKIVIKDIPTVEQGQTIDLKDYVSILNPSSSDKWTYELLTDSVHASVVTTVSEDAPSIYDSTKLLAVRAGRVNFRVSYNGETEIGYFDVTVSSTLKELANKIDEMDFSSYTVTKNFAMDASYQPISVSPSPLLYKNENYVFFPADYYGQAIHQKTNLAYYYQLNGAEDKYALSFNVMTNVDKGSISTETFKATYEDLSNYFNADTMRYYSLANTFLNEPYCLCYETATSTIFTKALSALGISYSHKVNNYTFYTIALVPKFVDNALQIYAISAMSNGSAILEGPYVFSNVGNTTIKVVEDFSKQDDEPFNYANNDQLVERLTGIESLTATLTGQYEDLDGNKIDVPSYFASSLPEVDSKLKWNSKYFYSNLFNLIDGGEDEEVLLANETEGGNDVVNRYVLDSSGKYTAKTVLAKDPTSGVALSDWQKGRSFIDTYMPVSSFPTTSWKYVAANDLGEGKYYLSGFNDSIGKFCIRSLLAGISASKYFGSSSAFTYFGIYAQMEVNLGTNLTDDITGETYTRLKNLTTGEYYVYHVNFNISNINSTVIEAPVAA